MNPETLNAVKKSKLFDKELSRWNDPAFATVTAVGIAMILGFALDDDDDYPVQSPWMP